MCACTCTPGSNRSRVRTFRSRVHARAPLVRVTPEFAVASGRVDSIIGPGSVTEGDIFQSQPRAVPEEGTEEQEDNSEDGHRALHLDRMVNKSGVECGVCRWGDVTPRLQRSYGIFSRDREHMTSTSKNARVAGFLYLLLTIAAPIRLFYIPSTLF